MHEIDRSIRRSGMKLAAINMALGFMLEIVVRATIVDYSIDRVVVIPLAPGVEV